VRGERADETAADSEEMREERDERKEEAAVVSKERVLNGRPVTGIPVGRIIVVCVVISVSAGAGEAYAQLARSAVSVATVVNFMANRFELIFDCRTNNTLNTAQLCRLFVKNRQNARLEVVKR